MLIFFKHNNLIIWAMSTINNTNTLEQLLQDTYTNYSIPETKGNSWAKINNRVARYNFFRFKLLQVNVYYAAAILLLVGVGMYFFYSKMNTPVKKDSVENVMSDSTMKGPVLNKVEQETDIELLPSVNSNEEISVASSEVLIKTTAKKSVYGDSNNILPSITNKVEEPKVISETDFNESDKIVDAAVIIDTDSISKVKNTFVADTVENVNKSDMSSQPITNQIIIQTDTIVKVIKKRRRRKK